MDNFWRDMPDEDDAMAASQALAAAVTAVRRDVIKLSRAAFCEQTGFPKSTMAAIEHAKRPSYWTETLAHLDAAIRSFGVDWPGATQIMADAGSGAPTVTLEMVDIRFNELFERRRQEGRADLLSLTERLDADDRELLTALARWLACRAG